MGGAFRSGVQPPTGSSKTGSGQGKISGSDENLANLSDLAYNAGMSDIIPFAHNPESLERLRALAERRGDSARATAGAAAEIGVTLLEMETTIQNRQNASPEQSYAAKLLQGPEDNLLKKLGEEATETALAAKSGNANHLAKETADLWFHCVAALVRYNSSTAAVAQELRSRAGTSGLAEKESRQK